MFAQGVYGEDSGYTWMDQNLKDKLLSMPRAAELAARRRPDVTLQQIREQLSGPGVSDEELLLRFIMKGDREIAAMRAAGPPKQYFTAEVPLVTLIDTLKKCKQVRFVNLQRGSDTLTLRNQIAVR